MSVKLMPMIICDGCGAVVEADYHYKVRPQHQKIVQRDPSRSTQRDFCSEACEQWWFAQFPAAGPWGPAWEERDWWCSVVGPCAESTRVRTTHEEAPLVDVKVHFDTPEHVK